MFGRLVHCCRRISGLTDIIRGTKESFAMAVTVSVALHYDGSIAECSVDSSIIKPNYVLTYESASEFLQLNLEEVVELKILSEATALQL